MWKALELPKLPKKLSLKGVPGEMWNSAPRESLISIFQAFLLVLPKILFSREDCALGYHSMTFRHFPDIS